MVLIHVLSESTRRSREGACKETHSGRTVISDNIRNDYFSVISFFSLDIIIIGKIL